MVDLNRAISVISTSEDVRDKVYIEAVVRFVVLILDKCISQEQREWADMIDADVLKSLPESEINRQTYVTIYD